MTYYPAASSKQGINKSFITSIFIHTYVHTFVRTKVRFTFIYLLYLRVRRYLAAVIDVVVPDSDIVAAHPCPEGVAVRRAHLKRPPVRISCLGATHASAGGSFEYHRY